MFFQTQGRIAPQEPAFLIQEVMCLAISVTRGITVLSRVPLVFLALLVSLYVFNFVLE